MTAKFPQGQVWLPKLSLAGSAGNTFCQARGNSWWDMVHLPNITATKPLTWVWYRDPRLTDGINSFHCLRHVQPLYARFNKTNLPDRTLSQSILHTLLRDILFSSSRIPALICTLILSFMLCVLSGTLNISKCICEGRDTCAMTWITTNLKALSHLLLFVLPFHCQLKLTVRV